MSIRRSYKRNIARNHMILAGYRRINDHGDSRKNGSYFSKHWREHLSSYKK